MKQHQHLENNKHLKGNPFTVPEDYFKHLNEGLQNIPLEHPQTKVRFLQNSYLRIFAVAATLVLAFTIGWFSQVPPSEKEALTTEDIIALTEGGYLPFSDYDVLMVLDDQEIEALIPTQESGNTEYLETTQPDLVEDYYLTLDNI
jgi:hypothetical protein